MLEKIILCTVLPWVAGVYLIACLFEKTGTKKEIKKWLKSLVK